MSIGVEYNAKTDTTTFKCDICKEWYYEDEVIFLDCNNDIALDIRSIETIHCHMCYDNN